MLLALEPKVDNKLVVYVDASHNGKYDNGYSRTSFIVIVSGATITWYSKKQMLRVARSPGQAKLIAVDEVTELMLYVEQFCESINLKVDNTELKSVSKSTLDVIQSNKINSKIVPMRRVIANIHQLFDNNSRETKKISFEENCSDLFTKILSPKLHNKHSKKIGLKYNYELN